MKDHVCLQILVRFVEDIIRLHSFRMIFATELLQDAILSTCVYEKASLNCSSYFLQFVRGLEWHSCNFQRALLACIEVLITQLGRRVPNFRPSNEQKLFSHTVVFLCERRKQFFSLLRTAEWHRSSNSLLSSQYQLSFPFGSWLLNRLWNTVTEPRSRTSLK